MKRLHSYITQGTQAHIETAVLHMEFLIHLTTFFQLSLMLLPPHFDISMINGIVYVLTESPYFHQF